MSANRKIENFDTLAESGQLRDSGMPAKQADATVNSIARAVSGLVTREHLDDRLEKLETKFDARFEKLETRIDLVFHKTIAIMWTSQVAVVILLYTALQYAP